MYTSGKIVSSKWSGMLEAPKRKKQGVISQQGYIHKATWHHLYMWKPFHYFFARFRRHWGIQTTIMDAFVTFFFLSTTKLLSVSFALLMSTKIYTSVGKLYSHSLYYDPSIKYFGKEHLSYALMANAILVFFIAFPTYLLLFLPFQDVLKMLS